MRVDSPQGRPSMGNWQAMARKIKGLVWARRLPGRPGCIPQGRARGVKALGVRYEREVAQALPVAEAGVWWEFEDQGGRGYCQTDLLVIGARSVLVLEAKYTYTVDAWRQLLGLYQPVVERALGLPVLPVQVCKVLVPQARNVTTDLESAVELARSANWATLHWIGAKGQKLWPPLRPPVNGHVDLPPHPAIAA
jgi:hypothetical protein